ncbi:hypothetical protein IQ235_12945 [Oscillatoriales cyanobacterium LEGE 11467]|uniref:Uncharacterized protein n=1 Tax=Zarconia navalis LEGE 11467 TaxID=1828826 RepID=A0A928VYM7_9CYAN|nr:hypothetical protein [Zarconia navalis]MBE9041688.1 hypothetical protein [Zarconia navalis LEGE 11467]
MPISVRRSGVGCLHRDRARWRKQYLTIFDRNFRRVNLPLQKDIATHTQIRDCP